MKPKSDNLRFGRNDRGLALMVVLVLLVVLCAIAYTLTSRVSAHRRRTQFMIDYQAVRYACDSAVKYALTTLQDINQPVIIERPTEPDFSDLFAMDEMQRRELLADWAESITAEQALKHQKKVKDFFRAATDINDFNDVNDFNNIDSFLGIILDSNLAVDINDPNNLEIPGPYGPPWPLITEPLNFMIGDTSVTIEIHDENAKYPLVWIMLDDIETKRQIKAGFETFCEWMDVDSLVVQQIEDEIAELNEIKQYKLKVEDIKITKKEQIKSSARARRARRRTSRRKPRTRVRTTVTTIPATVHLTDYARLYHSPLVNTEALARPTIVAADRSESALKYISLWPSNVVNINTAPRHVLETAFAFGGLTKAVDVADSVIQRRRIEPFEDVNEIRREFFNYADTVDKCRQYIVTNSELFTIRITASRGLARASVVIAVRNSKGKMEKIAVLSG